MGVIVPDLTYEYQGTTLAGTTTTDCLTVGALKAADCIWVEVVRVTVTNPTGGALAAAALYIWDGTAERTVIPASFGLPSTTENLEYEFNPSAHLETGHAIRVKGVSGHHVHVSFVKGTIRGSDAQSITTASG
jgi:hypothetical protein